MLKGKHIIGVCMTKINSISHSDYLNRLHHMARARGCKLIVFNSFADFFNKDIFDKGAAAIFDIINYDLLDVLVVHLESFHTKDVALRVISEAKAHNVPVVIVGDCTEEIEGCFYVIPDYDTPFKQLMSHVISEHGARDTYFITGRKGLDISDEERNLFFEDVATAAKAIHKIFHPDKVNYGAYGDGGCHLHFHLVPKYKGEYEWGTPFAMNPGLKKLSDEEYAEMIEKIKVAL